jgi:hypothetical protein
VSDSTVCLSVCLSKGPLRCEVLALDSRSTTLQLRRSGLGACNNLDFMICWILIMQPFVVSLRTAFQFCYTLSLIWGVLFSIHCSSGV